MRKIIYILLIAYIVFLTAVSEVPTFKEEKPGPELTPIALYYPEPEPTTQPIESTEPVYAEKYAITPIESEPLKELYTDKDLKTIAKVVHAEARGEPIEGQIAVANVVMNRYESGKFGKALKHITRRSQFAKSKTYTKENMKAVLIALEERPLPENVYFFQVADRKTWKHRPSIKKYCRIGKHTFYTQTNLKGEK